MERDSDRYLARWIQSRHRKPLVLRGARQVGKSTLVRRFAAARGLTLNEINLERHLELDGVFASLDMGVMRGELDALAGRSIAEPGSLLFLDEIQATPSAVQALRYFHEDLPSLPVIGAGSLIEFVLADHDFSMPVGRIEYHHLGPMTFREFLAAVDEPLCRYLEELSFESRLPEAAHQQLLTRQRQYSFVGGMPEAVLVFQESGSFEEATVVHRSIISTYEDDFAKYARHRELTLLQRVFQQIPRQIGHKVKYVNLSREDRARDVRTAIDLLAKARVCTRVLSSHCSGIPLYADVDENAYKLLHLDVGLMNHVCGLRWPALARRSEVQLVNEGASAEQFVGQHLAYSDGGLEPPRLVYWLREGRKNNAEVDFVISSGTEIVPIEVKSGATGTLRSLHQLIATGKAERAVRFDTNPPTRQQVEQRVPVGGEPREVGFELLSLPLYGVGEIKRLLAATRGRSADL
jgi:uncharacterized protein